MPTLPPCYRTSYDFLILMAIKLIHVTKMKTIIRFSKRHKQTQRFLIKNSHREKKQKSHSDLQKVQNSWEWRTCNDVPVWSSLFPAMERHYEQVREALATTSRKVSYSVFTHFLMHNCDGASLSTVTKLRQIIGRSSVTYLQKQTDEEETDNTLISYH